MKEASDLQLGLIFQLVLGLLKIHSSQSSPQQAVLTIPSQLKPLSVNTSGGVQTILMPVNKGESVTVGRAGVRVRVGRAAAFRWRPLPVRPALWPSVLPGTLDSGAPTLALNMNPR